MRRKELTVQFIIVTSIIIVTVLLVVALAGGKKNKDVIATEDTSAVVFQVDDKQHLPPTTTTTTTTIPPTTTTTQPPLPSPKPAAAQSWSVNWDAIAECESGGNWSINTGNGYYGGLQFNLQTWRGVGGSGYPHENSKEEQIYRAELLYASRGVAPWPTCGKYG